MYKLLLICVLLIAWVKSDDGISVIACDQLSTLGGERNLVYFGPKSSEYFIFKMLSIAGIEPHYNFIHVNQACDDHSEKSIVIYKGSKQLEYHGTVNNEEARKILIWMKESDST